jgi:hypothetical protein
LAASTSYQLNYTFNATLVSATVTSNATGTYTISNLASGTYSNITVTLSGCVSNTIASLVLTGNSSTATPIITGNSTICAGQLLLLTATTSTTGGTVTYTWTGPNGITQTGTTNSLAIVNTTSQSAGLYSVTASVNNCISVAATKTVIIKSSTTSTTNASICVGQSFTFNGVVYNSTGIYSTTLSNASGCDSIAILNLSVAPAVTTTPSAILGTININKCDTLQTYRVNAVNGVIFVWTVTGTGNYVKNGQGTNIVSLVMKSAGIVSVVATNSCGFTSSATKLTIIKSVPTTPGVIYQKISPKLITANTNVCMYNQTAFASTNQADTFMIKSVANARGYFWKTPTGSIVNRINDTTIAVVFSNALVLPDAIKVYSISECDTSIAKSLPLTKVLATSPAGIYKSFAANSTTGTAAVTSVCSLVGGGIETYKIRKIATATAYNWSLRIGTNAVITHLNPLGINDTAITVRYNTGFTKDTISVISVNGCGVSVAKTLAVSAVLLPPTPASVVASSGNFNPCIGNLVQYTASSTTPLATQSSIAVYRWTLPTYSTIISSNADSSIISVRFNIGYVGGSISVKGQSACGIFGTAKSVTLKYLPPTPTSITSSTGIYNACIGNSITYTVVAPAPSVTQLPAVKYRWTKPNFTTITSATTDSSTITVSFNTGYVGGSLTVKGQTACGALGTAKTQALTHTACALGTKISNSTVSESFQKMDLKILPNPTTTEFNIQLLSPSKEIANIKVMDLQGRVIQTLKTKSFDKINVGNNFKPGVYLIEVKQGSQKMTYRAVKF